LRWLALIRDAERPHFLLLHFIDPHAPYDPPADEISTRFEHRGSRPLSAQSLRSYQIQARTNNSIDVRASPLESPSDWGRCRGTRRRSFQLIAGIATIGDGENEA
jgi:hypothetical protein